jgi:Fatty acid hydroxylase superfamily
MLQTVSRLLPELPLILMTAVATHLVMSFAQTLMHYKLGHHPIGGKFFRNHINFHHAHYSKDHLVSRTYLSDEGNNTPFFFIPVFLVGACTYLVLPVDLFVVQAVACAASFYAHVFFDKEYHVEGSRLQRFAWFKRKQELHFVHHRHANSNFAVIHFFWDRILGTYRRPDAGQTQANGTLRIDQPVSAIRGGPCLIFTCESSQPYASRIRRRCASSNPVMWSRLCLLKTSRPLKLSDFRRICVENRQDSSTEIRADLIR